MQPNIGRSGRIARGITGTLCLAGGLSIVMFRWIESPFYGWTVGVLLMLAGGFQLFEARRGWCVMRACGFRTPM